MYSQYHSDLQCQCYAILGQHLGEVTSFEHLCTVDYGRESQRWNMMVVH